MIYLFTSSQEAAREFRAYLKLKRTGEGLPFPVFSDGNTDKWEENGTDARAQFILVTYRGGGIAAATAIGSICTVFGAEDNDALVYIGRLADRTAGVNENLFLCHKITESSSGRNFYPDILYRHSLPERAVRDEEAAAVYQAGACFFGPHQMIFLEAAEEAPIAQAAVFAEELVESDFYSDNKKQQGRKSYDKEEAEWTDRLCEALCCSQTMRLSVLRLIRYEALAGIDYKAAVNELFREGKLPCKDKREGKARLEELKRKLL